MLRVGLTGGLGSGKSTVAELFQALGAHVLSSDEIGRALMQPGEAVFESIVRAFGPPVLRADGYLDRQAMARIAFAEGRVEEVNAIVHPAVIDRQEQMSENIARTDQGAVVVVESALIFETKYGGGEGWRSRFDRLILVTAPEEIRIKRFVARSRTDGSPSPKKITDLEDEAHRRIAQQIPDDRKAPLCDYVLINSGSMPELEWQVDRLWPLLVEAADRAIGPT